MSKHGRNPTGRAGGRQASAGLAYSTALLRYLAEGEFEIERETEAFEDVVTRKVWRVKPVLPPGEEEGGEGDGDESAGAGDGRGGR